MCLPTTTGWHPRVALDIFRCVACVEAPGKAPSRPARLSSWENVVVAGPGRHRSWSMFCTPRATRVRHTPQGTREIPTKGVVGACDALKGACVPCICAPGTKVVIINDVKFTLPPPTPPILTDFAPKELSGASVTSSLPIKLSYIVHRACPSCVLCR